MINTATNTVSTTVSVGLLPQEVAITPDGAFAYVTNPGSDTVSVIDTTLNTVTTTIPAGDGPFAIAITPDGSFAYVTDTVLSQVLIFDTATNLLSTSTSVGALPVSIAITPITLPPPPINPSSLAISGSSKKSSFLTQTEFFNEIRWQPPSNGTLPANYKIYRDGALIAVIPASSPRIFEDHNRKKNRRYIYRIDAENETGVIATGKIQIP